MGNGTLPTTGSRVGASATRQLSISVVAGAAAGSVAGLFGPWAAAWLVGWVTTVLVLVALVWTHIVPMDPERTRGAARTEDPRRSLADTLLLLAAVSSLVGAALTVVHYSQAKGGGSVFLIIIAITAVVASWAVVPTVFTLRYAHLFYRDPVGGIDFHQEGDTPPNYVDFAYMAFTVAMTFQVSDTEINSSDIRATTLRQSLLSYLFGAVIVAATINVVAGFLAH